MNKRLTRSDYIFTLIFIAMLVFAVAAFFYGVKTGINKIETKYEAMLNAQKTKTVALTAYNQQYLVSFYHTIYSPFREFQKKWLDHLNVLETPSSSMEPKSLMKELKSLSEAKYAEIERISMPASSPLLEDAQTDFLKSLKLFSQAADHFTTNSDGTPSAMLAEKIMSHADVQEAINFALTAQQSYYAAIVKWNETVSPNMQDEALLTKENLNFDSWNKLNLNEKNTFVAKMMEREKMFTSYFPQDMTIRVDEMIAEGSAKKLNLSSIADIVKTLANTHAVRAGDFSQSRNKYYMNETLPQLPFYSDQ